MSSILQTQVDQDAHIPPAQQHKHQIFIVFQLTVYGLPLLKSIWQKILRDRNVLFLFLLWFECLNFFPPYKVLHSEEEKHIQLLCTSFCVLQEAAEGVTNCFLSFNSNEIKGSSRFHLRVLTLLQIHPHSYRKLGGNERITLKKKLFLYLFLNSLCICSIRAQCVLMTR